MNVYEMAAEQEIHPFNPRDKKSDLVSSDTCIPRGKLRVSGRSNVYCRNASSVKHSKAKWGLPLHVAMLSDRSRQGKGRSILVLETKPRNSFIPISNFDLSLDNITIIKANFMNKALTC